MSAFSSSYSRGVRCSSCAADRDPTPRRIQLHGADANLPAGLGDRTKCSPHGSSDTGLQLGHPEGLGEIVVRAGVERGHLVALLVERGEDDDRCGRLTSDAPHDGQTIDAGQPEVEQHQVRASLVPKPQRLLAVGCLAHLVSVSRQIGRDGAAGRLVVLDEQQPDTDGVGHGSEPSAGSSIVIARPPSGLAAALTVPFMAVTMPWTTVRPSPNPRRAPPLLDFGAR